MLHSSIQVADFIVQGKVYEASELFLQPVVFRKVLILLLYLDFIDEDLDFVIPFFFERFLCLLWIARFIYYFAVKFNVLIRFFIAYRCRLPLYII